MAAMQNYAELLFTDAVKAYQETAGMREKYESIYANRHRGPLDEDTIAFLSGMTSFYIATTGANGWPYIQHRGGPAGFVKVLGPETIGFADYLGNRQFITRGNLDGSNRVSLFFMDYPRRARLKMLGEAQMIDAASDPDLQESLSQDGQGPVERLVSIRIVALDWNCPKYILPRYTEDQVAQMIAPKLNQLVEENQLLKARIAELESGQSPRIHSE
ncbi:MAG: pyridoxamine 5'-phosphate oxidase family protein [Hyphomonas sp.]|nr:pyridoxamine 5'-phosphate oxidase family protein [Hyphomonas sp.]